MGAVEKIFLPYPVPPNRNVQISINFVAPESIGSKRSDWKLVNANDVAFLTFISLLMWLAAEINPLCHKGTPN
jgi:hypothetical protein